MLQAIRALPDTPAKNITSIRKALSKSTKLSYKAMTIKETLALSLSASEIGAMNEYEMFDHFLEKCQVGLNLSFRDARRTDQCLQAGTNPKQG